MKICSGGSTSTLSAGILLLKLADAADAAYSLFKDMRQPQTKCVLYTTLLLAAFVLPQAAQGGYSLGGGSNFAILFEGGGNNTLQVTNVTVNYNVGVGGTGLMTDSGPSTINGAIDFSAANTGQFSNNNGSDVIAGGVHYNVSAVASALNDVNTLNSTLGAESGTNISIGTGSGQTLAVNASAGVLDANGNRVFKVIGFNTTNGNVLTINGDGAGDSVVLNFIGLSANFNNQVVLNNISADQVLYNFVGGSGLTGGPTLQINDNLSNNTPNCKLGQYCVQGDFLDPNGPISVTNAFVFGRVFGGDTHDFQYVSGADIDAPPTPEPAHTAFVLVLILGIALAARKKLIRS
jgi:hypothetical protein